jgi:hypothetical protein
MAEPLKRFFDRRVVERIAADLAAVGRPVPAGSVPALAASTARLAGR